MEAATTPTTVTSLDDTTTQEYEQEEVPLESGTHIVDEKEVGAVITLNEDDEEKEEEEVRAIANLNENDAAVHATLAKTLPKFVIIQINFTNRYLHFYNENPDLPNALRFAGDYSFGLETRFEVEPATTGTGLIHIRCLHNNKYWANFSRSWVTAIAAKPEENQSDPHCTLFQPIFLNSNNNRVLKLRHVRSGFYVSMLIGSGLTDRCLTLLPTDHFSVCTFIDWESVMVLPDIIRIKGNNGKHLCAWADGFMDYQFEADHSSLFDYEVSPSRNGGIRLKSTRFGNYWTDMNNSTWVLLREASLTTHSTNTIFLPTIVGGNRIVMRSLKDNKFCNRHTGGGKRDCLATLNTYPDDWSYMEIEEPVISRRIYNIRYRLTDAKLHNQRTFALITDEVINRTQLPQRSQINMKKTFSNTANWSNSVTLRAGMTLTIQRGVPLVASVGFEISTEIEKSFEWGGTETETEERGNVRPINVPPMSGMRGILMATRVSYDIPFSYTQRDNMANGNSKISEKDDGLFVGHNGFGYDTDIIPFPLE